MPFRSIFLILLLAPFASAQTSLQLRPAWGNKDRAARWNAMLVRVSNPMPRDVTLQLISPEPGGFASILEEHIAIGPSPATFEILAPTHTSTWRQTIAVLRDSTTGRFLAQYPPANQNRSPDVPAVGPRAAFVGISGTAPALDVLASALNADFGFLPQHQLPRSATGYDSLDVLLLNRPAWAALDLDQQRAILDWTRAGGALLFTPGDGTPPPNSPLAGALPCTVGDLRQLDLPAKTLSDLKLSPRFGHIPVRSLGPTNEAEPFALFNGAVTAYSRRLGLGRILVLPFDIRTLRADDPADRPAVVPVWQSILATLIRVPKPSTETPRYATPFNGFQSESPDQFRQGAANATACDFLSPPGREPRRWPHVALVLLGIFFVVGPLDCFVLKLAGHSPWTWTTMVGWISCFVLGGLYVTSLFSRPASTFATLRLIDQCDDRTIATTDLIAIHLPHTIGIEPSPPDSAAGWWEPAFAGPVNPVVLKPAQPDVTFHDSDEACLPTVVLPSDQTQFFRRQSLSPSAPAVSARLRLTSGRITGTIQNLLPTGLRDIRLRTSLGIVSVPLDSPGVLAPNQTLTIDLPARGEAFSAERFEGRYQNFGDWGSRTESSAVREQDLWAVVPDLAARRSLKIDALFDAKAPLACIYAQCVDPAPTAKPADASDVPLKAHQWLRALIPLASEPI